MAITADRSTAVFNGEAHAPLAEAVGGIATIVLAIIALANVATAYLIPINSILFGAVLLILAFSTAIEFSTTAAHNATGSKVGGSGMPAVLLAGAAGIVLGILGLIGIHSDTLIAASVIIYGAAMMLVSSSSLQQHALGSQGNGESVVEKILPGSADVQALGGLAAIVLGLISLTKGASSALILVAFLVLGAIVILSPTMWTRMTNKELPSQ